MAGDLWGFINWTSNSFDFYLIYKDDLFAISAIDGQGIEGLLNVIADIVRDPVTVEDIALAFEDGRKRAWLFESDIVEKENQSETGYVLTVRWNQTQKARFAKL